MDGANDSGGAPTAKVVFKKRVVKGQLRSANSSSSVLNEAKRGEEEGGADDDDDVKGSNGVDKKTLEDVKFEQQLRRRQMGLDAKLLLKKPAKPAAPSSSSSSSSASSAAAATTGALFTPAGANADDNIDSLNPHEKIMETYVAEKLGLNKTEGDGSSAPLTADEKLYRVPAEIKALEGRAPDEEEAGSSEAEVGIYAGIAEVALPVSFKLKNQQETERAIRALEAQGKIHHHVQQNSNFRFQQGGGKEAGNKRPRGDAPPRDGPPRKPGTGQAHDNYVMQQFKKRNMR